MKMTEKLSDHFGKIGLILQSKGGGEINDALLPIVDGVRELAEHYEALEEKAGGIEGRFKKEDDERSKKEKRSKGTKFWNDSLGKTGDGKEGALAAARYVVEKVGEVGKGQGLSPEKINEQLDGELDDLMEKCEQEGRDPIALISAMAKQMGYTPEESKKIAEKAVDAAEQPEGEGDEGKPPEGENPESPAESEPDAEEVMKRAKTSPAGSAAAKGKLNSDERLKLKKRSTEDYYRNLGK